VAKGRTKGTNKAFKCPKCFKPFHRKVGSMKGKTSCFWCGAKFSREEGCAEHEPDIGQQIAARKQKSRAKRYEKKLNTVLQTNIDATIKGDQTPISEYEANFKAKCLKKGWLPHRPSWPDFLVQKDGQLIFVEVKGGRDSLSTTQQETFRVLEKAGIKTYVWWNRVDDKLMPWREFHSLSLEVSQERKRRKLTSS